MKTSAKVLATGFVMAVAFLLVPGVAGAAETPIWVLPGVDLGSLLGPTVGVPGGLAPVFDLLRLIGG